MIALFRLLFNGFLGSFHNEPGGWSGRKLFAFGGSILAAWVTFEYADKANAVELVITWLSSALLALGIITAQQIIDLRAGGKKNPPPTTT